MKRLLLIVVAAIVAAMVAGCGSSSAPGSSGSSAAEQAFESDVALVKYREAIEPTQGNVMFNFALENRTDRTVMVSGENAMLNGQFAVQTLGGAAAPIAPGTTGSVSITLGYTVQTPIENMDGIESFSCDLVLRDNDNFDVIGAAPVAVSVK